MKICEHCQAYNSDSRQFCVDCSKKLGDPISPEEEKRIRHELDNKVDDLYESGEPYKIEAIDYVLGIASAASFIILVVALILSIVNGYYQSGYFWMTVVGALFTGLSLLACFWSELLHEINTVFLEIRYHNAYDLTPNPSHFLFGRRITSALLTFIVFVMIFLILYKP